MANAEGWDFQQRAVDRFQPVSDMLDSGECEPMKAAVHGLLMATVAVCAAYNTAAWIKRRQSHLAINAVVYSVAVWWESCHIRHHLRACPVGEPNIEGPNIEGPEDNLKTAA
jgi:hypothetical protein